MFSVTFRPNTWRWPIQSPVAFLRVYAWHPRCDGGDWRQGGWRQGGYRLHARWWRWRGTGSQPCRVGDWRREWAQNHLQPDSDQVRHWIVCDKALHNTSVADQGCLSRIPDPTFFHPGSWILIKEFKYFNPKKAKKWFLSSKKYDPGCSSRIPDLDADFLPSRIPGSKRYPIPDPEHWKVEFFRP